MRALALNSPILALTLLACACGDDGAAATDASTTTGETSTTSGTTGTTGTTEPADPTTGTSAAPTTTEPTTDPTTDPGTGTTGEPVDPVWADFEANREDLLKSSRRRS